MWNVTLRILEDGFFEDGPHRGDDNAAGFSFRPVAGLAESTKFVRVRVDADGFPEQGGEVWLISAIGFAEDGARIEQLRALIGRALPQADLCFVVEERAGFARVIAGNPRRAVVIAAAMAVVRYAHGWDESQSIAITVGDERYAVSVGFEGKNYRVAVRPA